MFYSDIEVFYFIALCLYVLLVSAPLAFYYLAKRREGSSVYQFILCTAETPRMERYKVVMISVSAVLTFVTLKWFMMVGLSLIAITLIALWRRLLAQICEQMNIEH